jgi:hypothetical protein
VLQAGEKCSAENGFLFYFHLQSTILPWENRMNIWDGSLDAEDQARQEGAQTRLAGRQRDDLHSISTEIQRLGRRDSSFRNRDARDPFSRIRFGIGIWGPK